MSLLKSFHLAVFFICLNVFAQSSEKSLGASDDLAPSYGGIVKKLSHGRVEIVHKKEKTKIYWKDLRVNDGINRKLQIDAEVKIRDKKYPVQLSFENDAYSFTPATHLQKENNFTLMLSVTFDGKKDTTAIPLKND